MSSGGTNLVHLNGDGRSGLDRALLGDGAGAGVATDVVGVYVGDGGVGRRDTGALVVEVNAIDPEGLEGGVGGDIGCQPSEGGDD